MALFSIIIPTYNAAATIKSSINSILNQTYSDLEIVVVDGLSTDDTGSIVKDWQKNEDRIKWSSEKDRGIYDAMNKGIEKSSGNWLFFMGSDDSFYDHTVLQNIVPHLKDADVVYGDVYNQRFDSIYDGAFTPEKLLKRNICHQAIFLHKKVFNKIGKFNLLYPVWADWDHNLKWLSSKKIKSNYVNIIVANYAEGGFSHSRLDSFDYNRYWNYIKYNKHRIGFLDKLRSVKAEIRRSLDLKKKDRAVRILFEAPYIFF